jgi:hypothetical protein
MFDNIRMHVRFADLQSRITEEELGKIFAPGFPRSSCRSPLRQDKHPSFGYFHRGGKWRWKDQATGEYGNLYELIRRLYNLDTFQDTLQYINSRLSLGLEQPLLYRPARIIESKRQLKNLTREVFMQVIRKEYTPKEYTIWKRWCTTAALLRFYDVWSASQLWMRDDKEEMKLLWTRTDDNPIFFAHFPESRHIKAYRPLETDRKKRFLGNANNTTDIQGYKQCNIKQRRPHLLILTKALKECIFYRSFGLDAMAPHGEGHHFDPDFIRHIRKYCGRIISFYDNDRAGIHAAWQVRDEYDIPAFIVPRQWGAKNVTDAWEIDKHRTYSIIQYLSEWNSYHGHLTSHKNILRAYSNIETVNYTGEGIKDIQHL